MIQTYECIYFWDSVIIIINDDDDDDDNNDDDDNDRIIIWYRCMNVYIFGIQWLLIMMMIVELSLGTDV